MIKINLASKKQSSTVQGDQVGGRLKIAGLGAMMPGVDFDRIKELPIRKLITFIALGAAVDQLATSDKEKKMEVLNDAIQKIEAKKASLQADLAKTKGFEEIKKQLDADETTMRTKIDVIQKLLQDRAAPPKMMMALSNAIPNDVWLSSLEIDLENATFKGASLGGVNPISDFMKSLSQTQYFGDVRPTTGKEKDADGTDVDGFELKAKRR